MSYIQEIYNREVHDMEQTVFTEKSLPRMYFRFALPVVFSMVITMVYNLADTYFIASTGNTALVAGVSLCAPVFTFLMAIGNIFAQGGCSLISRLLGSQDTQALRHVSAFCVYVSLVSGVAIGIIMVLFHTSILHMLGAGTDTISYASQYYTVLVMGAPLIIVSFVYTNLLRAVGMSKEAMFGTVSGALINIILDPIFIFVMGLGSGGAGIATVLGYLFEDLYCFWIFWKKNDLLSVTLREVSIPKENVGQIFGIGIPASLSNIMTSISVGVINQLLLPYGTEKIATMGIVLKAYYIVLLVLTGLAFGGQPLYGYYFGSNDRKRLLELYRFCVCVISGTAVILSLVLFVTAPQILGCFLEDARLIADGVIMLRLQVVSTVFVGFVLLNTIVFQSAGKIAASFWLSISRQGLFFLPAILICGHVAGYYGILASQAIADVVTAVAAGILLAYFE